MPESTVFYELQTHIYIELIFFPVTWFLSILVVPRQYPFPRKQAQIQTHSELKGILGLSFHKRNMDNLENPGHLVRVSNDFQFCGGRRDSSAFSS